jgi:hypothetical protein
LETEPEKVSAWLEEPFISRDMTISAVYPKPV